LKIKIIFLISIIFSLLLGNCIDKTQPLPSTSTILFETKVEPEKNSSSTFQKEIVIKNTDLKAIVYEYNFNSYKKALSFFRKEIPQRPISRKKKQKIQSIRSTNGLWVINQSKVLYILFYFDNKEWNTLSKEEFKKYQIIINKYEDSLLLILI